MCNALMCSFTTFSLSFMDGADHQKHFLLGQTDVFGRKGIIFGVHEETFLNV